MSNTLITIFGIAFIFLMTTLGASVVYIFNAGQNKKLNSIFLGFASGVMIAASIWSLLLPAIEQSSGFGKLKFLPASVGFVVGGLFLVLLDKVSPNFHSSKISLNTDRFKQIKKLFCAVTIHNIPEGIAVGFAFGSATLVGTKIAFLSALGLAIGIGIQNFPEGTAVALPIRTATNNKNIGFLYGMLSGAVEPIFAILGYFLASSLQIIQPWLLSFAAGAMIFVVVDDLVPISKTDDNSSLGAWGVMLGFAIMMILDIALG